MKDTIIINDKEHTFRTSAALPIIYHRETNRDLLKDFNEISKTTKKNVLEGDSIEVLTDLAYCMALLGNKDIGTKEDWLDGFEIMDLYQIILPKVVELWQAEIKTTSTPKK